MQVMKVKSKCCVPFKIWTLSRMVVVESVLGPPRKKDGGAAEVD